MKVEKNRVHFLMFHMHVGKIIYKNEKNNTLEGRTKRHTDIRLEQKMILRRECDETLTNFPDFQYFVTRPGPRLLKI